MVWSHLVHLLNVKTCGSNWLVGLVYSPASGHYSAPIPMSLSLNHVLY